MRKFRTTIFILSALLVAVLFSSCGKMQSDNTTKAESVETDIPSGNLFSYESRFDESEPIYVIGHRVPDSDTVCSAIAFAELLKQLGYDSEPVISGNPNAETEYVLEKFGVKIPEIMDDADGKQFVLVDHSSYLQSINNMEDADVLGIVDHHNVGSIETSEPSLYLAMPVGSTATIVYGLYDLYNVTLTKEIAGIMLSAILSDTTGLKSVTTTEYDREAADDLMALAEIEDVEVYTEEMLKAGNAYDSMTIEEILYSDLKYLEAGDITFVIACVQSADADQLKEIEEKLDWYMEDNFDSIGYSPIYVMMTNQITAETKLLCYGDNALEIAKEAFDIEGDEIILENTLSRKKQVYPPLKIVLEK